MELAVLRSLPVGDIGSSAKAGMSLNFSRPPLLFCCPMLLATGQIKPVACKTLEQES